MYAVVYLMCCPRFHRIDVYLLKRDIGCKDTPSVFSASSVPSVILTKERRSGRACRPLFCQDPRYCQNHRRHRGHRGTQNEEGSVSVYVSVCIRVYVYAPFAPLGLLYWVNVIYILVAPLVLKPLPSVFSASSVPSAILTKEI